MESETRDRAATEKRILEGVGKIIAERGFERVGINAVSSQSGVSKVLIYRYFGAIDDLLVAYVRQYDYWINFPRKFPTRREELPDFLKKMFRRYTEQLRKNPALKRLHRWELSSNNAIVEALRQQRENTGLWLIEAVSKLTGNDPKDVATQISIITTSITYLVMLEDFYPKYNTIPLDKEEGWEQISDAFDALIDQRFKKQSCWLVKIMKLLLFKHVNKTIMSYRF